jgi:hypothetical protein
MKPKEQQRKRQGRPPLAQQRAPLAACNCACNAAILTPTISPSIGNALELEGQLIAQNAGGPEGHASIDVFLAKRPLRHH